MSGDDSQENARRAIGSRSPLFPVPQSRGLESELRSKGSLTESQPPSHLADVNHWNLNGGDANGDLFAFRPVHGLPQTCDDPAACAWFAPHGGSCRLHFGILFWYPATSRGTSCFSSLRSALLRFAFSFFANTLSRNSGSDSL